VRETLITGYKESQRSIRDDRWKLIRYPLINKTQLFDLQADPHEMRDLAAMPEQTYRIQALVAVLKLQQRQFGDNAPLEVANPLDPTWRPDMAGERPAGKKAK
jgi:arylsulfatase A-like enzyme